MREVRRVRLVLAAGRPVKGGKETAPSVDTQLAQRFQGIRLGEKQREFLRRPWARARQAIDLQCLMCFLAVSQGKLRKVSYGQAVLKRAVLLHTSDAGNAAQLSLWFPLVAGILHRLL